MKETFEQALRRCLEVECGLELPEDRKSFERIFHVRAVRYAGVLPLPKERWGERPVAADVFGTPLEKVQMKAKAYWMASVLLGRSDEISPKPDGKELLELRWFSLAEAREIIRATNHKEKADLLIHCLTMCEADLGGSTQPPG